MTRYAGLVYAALLGGFAAAEAATLHVRPDGTGDYPTIQAAVDAATDGDIVVLADGVFRGDGNRDVQVYYKDIEIRSESGDPTRTVIDCEGGAGISRRALRFQFSEVVFQGIGVTGGDTGLAFGGAAAVVGGLLTFRDCVFWRNRAGAGGAIAVETWTTVSIESCTFFENEATYQEGGSALWLTDHAWAQLNHCVVAFGLGGGALMGLEPTGYAPQCCDVYGNAGGDYVGFIAGQLGVNGNISADPLFCGQAGLDLDLSIATDSPCAPGGECGLMGALPIGCGPTPVEATTWGAIKALYRSE